MKSTGWLSWLGRLIRRICEQKKNSWAWKYTETGNMVSSIITKYVCGKDTQKIRDE
jgi:hypothetical protein